MRWSPPDTLRRLRKDGTLIGYSGRRQPDATYSQNLGGGRGMDAEDEIVWEVRTCGRTDDLCSVPEWVEEIFAKTYIREEGPPHSLVCPGVGAPARRSPLLRRCG